MTNVRNPFTPTDQDLTPSEFLQLYIDFSLWSIQNPLESTCKDNNRALYNDSLCCLDHINNGIEHDMLMLAGCRAGVFVEPEGFQNWLKVARTRSAELSAGSNRVDYWQSLMKEQSLLMNLWIYNTDISDEVKPYFSLEKFKNLCKKYDFVPDLFKVAIIFDFTHDEIVEFFNS